MRRKQLLFSKRDKSEKAIGTGDHDENPEGLLDVPINYYNITLIMKYLKIIQKIKINQKLVKITKSKTYQMKHLILNQSKKRIKKIYKKN